MKTDGLLSRINELQSVTEELKNQKVISIKDDSFLKNSETIRELKEKLDKEKFYLVVIGLFKRGKSSLVNALVQKEVVPYSVVPLTSIVTLLEYGDEDKAQILFNNGNVEVCGVESIYEYVTEIENPLNKKDVKYVNVLTNSKFLKKITLVDTPGIGSTFENNTETTYSFIKRIDAALFILSADLPISKTEVEFLTKLKSIVPKIIFVLNKVDLVEGKEADRIISFNKSVLRKVFETENINIIPVSARLAVDGMNTSNDEMLSQSGLGNLIDEIEKMLTVEKQDVLVKSTRNQFNSVLYNTESMLKIQLKALQTPISKLNEDYKTFQNSLHIMKKEKGDFEILINGKVKQLQQYVTESLYNYGHEMLKQFCKELDEDNHTLFSHLKSGGIEKLHKNYVALIENSYASLKLKLESEIIERFRNILVEYSHGSNKFLNELANNFSSQSLFDFNDLVAVFDLNIATSFYFRFDRNYNPIYLSKKNIAKIALAFLSKNIVNGIKEDLRRNIDMNTGRINYDINYKIQESFRKFNSLLNEKFEQTINMLDSIISETILKKEQTEEFISEQVEYITSKLEKLSAMREA